MNLKKNMTLVVGGAITLVLLIALLVLLLKFNSSYQKVNRELQTAQQRLAILNGRDPFPSEENVVMVQTNLTVLQELFRRLAASLQEGQAEPPKMEPAEFNLRLDQASRGLLSAAAKAKIGLPARFSFGFERYAVAGTLPDAADVPRLVTQLETVELLCNLLYASRIGAIETIERPVFEASARPATAPEVFIDPRQQRYGGGAPAASPSAGPADTYLDPSGLFTREKYTLIFRGRDAAVLDFLNAAAAHKRFIAVTRLKMENEMGIPKPVEVRSVSSGSPAPGAPPAAPVYLARQDRIAAGREPVKVMMDLEVYRFRTADSGETTP